MPGIAGERKEVIAQAVDVFDDDGFHFLSFHFQSYAAALGAAAYAAWRFMHHGHRPATG